MFQGMRLTKYLERNVSSTENIEELVILQSQWMRLVVTIEDKK